MLRDLLVLIISFFALSAYAEKDLVFVNKSYSKDLSNSVRLYKSFEEYVEEKVDFYVIVPGKEIDLFKKAFHEQQNRGEIKESPIFMDEKVVVDACGEDAYNKITTQNGWYVQQAVKMCFGKTGIAKNYFTMDSDIYFTRKFTTKILFKDGQAKTLSPRILKKNNKERFFKNPGMRIHSKVKKVLDDKTDNYNYMVAGYAMWSSDIVRGLESYVWGKHGYDLTDLLIIVPYEMQWYGEFILNHMPERFFPLRALFTLTEDKNMRSCPPTNGYPWDFGVLYNNVKGKKYKNKCSKLKTFLKVNEKRIGRWIRIAKGQNV